MSAVLMQRFCSPTCLSLVGTYTFPVTPHKPEARQLQGVVGITQSGAPPLYRIPSMNGMGWERVVAMVCEWQGTSKLIMPLPIGVLCIVHRSSDWVLCEIICYYASPNYAGLDLAHGSAEKRESTDCYAALDAAISPLRYGYLPTTYLLPTEPTYITYATIGLVTVNRPIPARRNESADISTI